MSLTIHVTNPTDVHDSSQLSLREAIELSNGDPAFPLAGLSPAERALVTVVPNPPPTPGAPAVPNNIYFNLPNTTGINVIRLVGSALPAVTAPVDIEGYTQNGSKISGPDFTEFDVNFATVQIDGSGLTGAGNNGIDIQAPNCVVDGLIITGFSGFGVSISGANTQGNWLWGDFVGALPDPTYGRFFTADPSARAIVSNALGGIQITSSNNRVGGNSPGLSVIIANNGFDSSGGSLGGPGLLIDTPGGTGNLIQNNGIFSNAGAGVFVRSSNNTIGEALPGGGNSIGGDGLLGNSIFGNIGHSLPLSPGYGIVLNPLTHANNLQPAPVITGVSAGGSATNVQGTIDALAASTYTIEFFSSPSKDSTGFGQGQTYLATMNVTTDSGGHASYALDMPVAVASGRYITATATDPLGNTSSFSKAVVAVPVGFKLGAATYTVNENGGAVLVTVRRTDPTGQFGGSFAVHVATSDGSAVAGTDYSAVSQDLFFNPGDQTKTISVPILDPHKIGGSATFHVTLSNPTNGSTLVNPSTSVVTIVDNDVSGVQFASAPDAVHGTGVANFTVVRDSGLGALTVHYASVVGSAVPGVNYVAASLVLTFLPGQTSKTILVTMMDDYRFHLTPLTFNLTLSNAVGGVLGPINQVVGTEVPGNNPGTFALNLARVQVAPNTSSVTLTVNRTVGKTGFVTVPFATGYGSAVAGLDYSPVSGVLTFWPGQYSQTITVPIKPALNPGANVTFDLLIGQPSGGASLGGPNFTIVTIVHPSSPILPPNPADRLAPTVLGVQTVAGPQGVYALVVSFSKAMDPVRAGSAANYAFFISGSTPGASNLSIGVSAAAYDPASKRVVLFLGAPIPRGGLGRLVINPNGSASAGRGVSDLSGTLLDGSGTGLSPGTAYQWVGH